MRVTGIPIYPGIVCGKAFLFSNALDLGPAIMADSLQDPGEKKDAVQHAVNKAHAQLLAAMNTIADKTSDAYTILEAQLSVLHDEAINEEILSFLEDGSCVSDAVNKTFDTYVRILENSENKFSQERVADLDDIRRRLLHCLAGIDKKSLGDMTAPSIIVAKELSPSDTATLKKDMVLAILTETGGETSHTAILARSLGIPTILGIEKIQDLIKDGDYLGVNAQDGDVFIHPDTSEISYLQDLKCNLEKRQKEILTYRGRKAETSDGTKIHVKLNIADAASVLDEDADNVDGVGLMRSEFLYMQSDSLPDEEKQYRAYCDALKKFKNKPVILRTLDIGGDKTIPAIELPKEENPFLGCRAIRLCFSIPLIFKAQVRAALRASAQGPLWLMFPMIGSLDDWRKAKDFVETTKRELKDEGHIFNPKMPLGIMIEIPSAALLSDRLANEVDFASVGTNDLCQYLNAADRLNPRASQYYQPYSPAMLRVLRYIAQQYEAAETPVSICGEIGGDPRATMLLVGMGFRTLSMNASSLGEVKETICHISLDNARHLAQKACDANNQEEVLQLLEEYQQTNFAKRG